MPTEKTVTKKAWTPHPYEERMRAVELYLQGNGCRKIARLMGLDDSMVRSWMRKYRAYGPDALQPYWRGPKAKVCLQEDHRTENERLFKDAYPVYATSLEPVASIARRFQLDYHSFKYHVQRYHPELVACRERLRRQSTVVLSR